MNRRGFLGLLFGASVTAPVVAKLAAPDDGIALRSTFHPTAPEYTHVTYGQAFMVTDDDHHAELGATYYEALKRSMAQSWEAAADRVIEQQYSDMLTHGVGLSRRTL